LRLGELNLAASINPAAPHALPWFITAPGETDTFLVVMAIFLVIAVMAVGLLFLRLHTLPERMAHSSQKLQFELVAVLGLLSLFTHNHIFWVAGLILALIDVPDWGTPLRRIAGSVERIAGFPPGEGAGETNTGQSAPDQVMEVREISSVQIVEVQAVAPDRRGS
jgi:multisubunit Na+/H+ antiporter MnhF subunit